MNSTKNKLTLNSVRVELATVGVTIRKIGYGDEIRVRIKNSPVGYGYFTNDLVDALLTGLDMAKTGNSIQI